VLWMYDEKSQSLKFFSNFMEEHEPYFYTIAHPRTISLLVQERRKGRIKRWKKVKKYDMLAGEWKEYLQVFARSPGDVGGYYDHRNHKQVVGLRTLFRNVLVKKDEEPKNFCWADFVQYKYRKLIDAGFNIGMEYKLKNKRIKPVEVSFDKNISKIMSDYQKEMIDEFMPLFTARRPKLPWCAIDIEVLHEPGYFPSWEKAEQPVISIHYTYSNKKQLTLMLKRQREPDEWHPDDENWKIEYFENERELLKRTIQLIRKAPPIILTYNGDNFDISYLDSRCKWFGIPTPFLCRPDYIKKDDIAEARIQGKIHVDLYKWFSMKAVKNYIYKGHYEKDGLDDVSMAILKHGKIEDETPIPDRFYRQLGNYNKEDSILNGELWEETMEVYILCMRIANVNMSELSRRGITFWHTNFLLTHVFREKNMIPNRQELNQLGEACTVSVIDGKKYKGANVKAIMGIYFNFLIMDFASLYPTIHKEYNISVETVNCPHETCRDNVVPGTTHWVCKERVGFVGELYGFFRDIRVRWFKSRDFNIQMALKIFLVSCYGAFSFEGFFLFAIVVGECILSHGRSILDQLEEKCESEGMHVSFEDTDSVGGVRPSEEVKQEIIEWASRELKCDLEDEDEDDPIKCMIIYMKKNYIKIYESGKISIKGMQGKKRNTPDVIKNCFQEIMEVVKQVEQ